MEDNKKEIQQDAVIIFAGPSLNATSKLLIQNLGLHLLPPVQRHDIDALVEQDFKGTIIIVDGMFREVLAVGHAEIRTAIEKGVQVFGISSMGAIRAYEMRHLGMKNFGQVYNWFFKMDDFQDDEVSLLHAPAPYYFSISEPLVHCRECVLDLVATKKLSAESGEQVIETLKALYFGERTLDLFFSLLAEVSAIDLAALKANFDRFRIKQIDLVNFLEQKIWLSA